jgi:hypothetical protein
MSHDLCDEIKIMLQSEKPDKTIEEVPTTYHRKYRRYSSRPMNWMSMENASRGAWFRLCHDRRFQEWTLSKKYLKNNRLDYYKFMMMTLSIR